MRNLVILGVSGSIGKQTIEVINHYQNEFNLIGVSVYSNVAYLDEILTIYPSIKYVWMKEITSYFKEKYPSVTFLSGNQGLVDLVSYKDIDVVLNGIVGFSGVVPTYYALKNNLEVCLANKESLVCAGDLINDLLSKGYGKLYPVDSEHCAITQCLVGEQSGSIKRLIITASGGPFRERSRSELANVTVFEALNHPTWKMGKKITIDSATLVNKGLEIIEAHYLFNVDESKIISLIHPTSIVHSLVEFNDGTIKAQLGVPSMTLPIQYALLRNQHGDQYSENFDLSKAFTLSFYPLDLSRFKSVKLAYEALRKKHGLPIVYNASNEVCVNAFLDEQIKFLEIEDIIEKVFNSYILQEVKSIEDVIKIDAWAREYTLKLIKERN